METIAERVRVSVETSVRSYEESAKREQESLSEKVRIAERLDEGFKTEEVTYYGLNFLFNSSTHEEAFTMTKTLLNLFPEIERFSKELDSSSGNWRWVGDVGNVMFIVPNATPDVNCTPRKTVRTYTIWACDMK